jgi:hypothetical protein
MAFVTDKKELKPGLIVFRRGDVEHRVWYCRMKIPNVDRYKTLSLKTTEIEIARERALVHDADLRAMCWFRYSKPQAPLDHAGRETISL